jgi:hypothetical protein
MLMEKAKANLNKLYENNVNVEHEFKGLSIVKDKRKNDENREEEENT